MKRIIKKVAVVGSGIMGSGIACHFANIGLEVLLLDIARSRITGPHCDLPVVSTVQEAARKTIQQPEITRRSIEDQQSFAEAPLKPPKPNAALKRAFKRHAKLIAPE